jgi:predicted GTPase
VLILGAAGRDFHNFNVVYRDDPATEVVAFTAAQIPGIAGRRYPPQLAGPRYPAGAVPCDVVLLGTPIDLGRILALRQPVVRVRYEIEEAGRPGFAEILGNL